MMQAIASIGLSNAAVAVIMAVAVFAVTRCWRSPPLAHALWLLVLLKFIAPPLVGVGLRLPIADTPAAPPAEAATIPPVEALSTMSTDIPSESHQERRGEAPSADVRSEPSHSYEPFDAWTRPAPPGPSELPFPAELPSEPVATDSIATDSVTPDDSERRRQATVPAALPQTVDKPIGKPLDKPLLGIALNFDAVWPYTVFIWLAGSGVWFAVVGVRMRRFGRLLKRTDAAPDSLCAEVAGLAAQFGLRTVPDVRLVAAAIPPLAWAMFGRPLLLLPRELVGRLDADERLTVLAHELAHLRRRDHLTRLLEICVLGLYWWQPVAWFARRQLHCAAEQCCDAWVVRRFPEHARAYAQALFKTVEFLADADATLPLGATGFSQVHLLERRFAMILQGRRTDRLSRAVRYGLLLVGLVILPLSIRSLWADDTKPAEPVPAATTDAAKPPAEAAPPATPPGTEATMPATPPASGAPSPPATAPPAPIATTPPATAPSLDLQPPMAVPPAATAPPVVPPDANVRLTPSPKRARAADAGNIDDRLSRLEATVETLVRELRSRPAIVPPPATYYVPATPYGTPSTPPNAVPTTPYRTPSILNAVPPPNNPFAPPLYAPPSSIPNAAPTKPDPATPRPYPSGSIYVGPAPPAPPAPDRYAVEVSGEDKDLRKDVESNIEERLEEPFVELKKQIALCETNKNRFIAARANVKAVDEAYKNANVTLDLLLDAQRRLMASEVEYADSLANLKKSAGKTEKQNDSDRLVALSNFRAAANAKSQALETWRHVHALFEKGAPGGEADKETPAREQYFLFKERTEKALATLRQQYGSDSRQQIYRDGPPLGGSRQQNESDHRQQYSYPSPGRPPK